MIEDAGIVEVIASSAKRAPWGWGVLAGVIIALIKVWPVLNDQIARVKEKRRSDRRDDAAEWRQEMRDRVLALEEKVKVCQEEAQAARDRSHKHEMRLMTVTSAFQMIAGELRKVDPDNPTLKQAIDLVGLAVTEDMGMNRAMMDLARIPGTRE